MDNNPASWEGYWRLLGPVWGQISIYDGPQVFLSEFRRVRPEVGHLFAGRWCQSEVCNGGFHQFFRNATGVLAPEALEAYRAIGLGEWASLLEEAMRFFGAPYPRDGEVRQERLATVRGKPRKEWDPFCELDERFYAWLHAEENHGNGPPMPTPAESMANLAPQPPPPAAAVLLLSKLARAGGVCRARAPGAGRRSR